MIEAIVLSNRNMSLCKPSAVEIRGCRRLLDLLDENELSSLLATITNKLVQAQTRGELIKAIISFTTSPYELLKRRKVSRDTLFRYLVSEGCTPSPKAEKSTLITQTLQLWGCGECPRVILEENEDVNNSSFSVVRSIQSPSASTPTPSTSFTPSRNFVSPGRVNGSVTESNQSRTGNIQSPIASIPQLPPPYTSSRNLIPPERVYASPQVVRTEELPVPACDPHTTELAHAFTKWFYEMLNSHHPASSTTAQDFGPHHFFPEAKLYLKTINQHEHTEDTFTGDAYVSQRLLALIKEEQVLFNPNLASNGLKAMMEQHGLCKIMVCGTVHSQTDVVGLFQQQFGLVRDGCRQNTWKIKSTYLQLKVGASQKMPSVTDRAWLPIES